MGRKNKRTQALFHTKHDVKQQSFQTQQKLHHQQLVRLNLSLKTFVWNFISRFIERNTRGYISRGLAASVILCQLWSMPLSYYSCETMLLVYCILQPSKIYFLFASSDKSKLVGGQSSVASLLLCKKLGCMPVKLGWCFLRDARTILGLMSTFCKRPAEQRLHWERKEKRIPGQSLISSIVKCAPSFSLRRSHKERGERRMLFAVGKFKRGNNTLRKKFIFRAISKHILLSAGPSLARAGTDLKRSCGARLSDVCRSFWGGN